MFAKCVEVLGGKSLVEVIPDDAVDADLRIEVMGCTVTTLLWMSTYSSLV
jgi:hypothetical protein